MRSNQLMSTIPIFINLMSLIINLLITLYSLYTYFDMIFFHNLQGSKLKIKKNSFK